MGDPGELVLYAVLVLLSVWLYIGSISGNFVFDDQYVSAYCPCERYRILVVFPLAFFSLHVCVMGVMGCSSAIQNNMDVVHPTQSWETIFANNFWGKLPC
jgi:hypothetical protein